MGLIGLTKRCTLLLPPTSIIIIWHRRLILVLTRNGFQIRRLLLYGDQIRAPLFFYLLRVLNIFIIIPIRFLWIVARLGIRRLFLLKTGCLARQLAFIFTGRQNLIQIQDLIYFAVCRNYLDRMRLLSHPLLIWIGAVSRHLPLLEFAIVAAMSKWIDDALADGGCAFAAQTMNILITLTPTAQLFHLSFAKPFLHLCN